MKICTIIAEYNPFHNGHKAQIENARALGYDFVVIIMSGNFVQRGTPSIFPYYVRAKAALSCGADLVIELPISFATASAQRFAHGGVFLVNSIGITNSLVFGAEHCDVKLLQKLVNIEKNENYGLLLKKELEKGLPWHTASCNVAEILEKGSGEILKLPNNILAIEYMRAIKNLNSEIKPEPLIRLGVNHNDMQSKLGFASASLLRENYYKKGLESMKNFVPEKAYEIYEQAEKDGQVIDTRKFEIAMLSRLNAMSKDDLGGIFGMSEGIENKIFASIMSNTSLEKIYDDAKSKRYPHARIRRLCLASALGIKSNQKENPSYINVLGASTNGLKLLKLIKEKSSLPYVHSASELLEIDRENSQCIMADRLYNMCLKTPKPSSEIFTRWFLKV